LLPICCRKSQSERTIKSIGLADCDRPGNKLPQEQEPITMQVDFFDGGPFAIWVLLFAVALISPLPFQLFKQGKKKTPSRRPAFFPRCNKKFNRGYEASKHFKKGICKPATTARQGGHARAPDQA
jgi:hypothetical protein